MEFHIALSFLGFLVKLHALSLAPTPEGETAQPSQEKAASLPRTSMEDLHSLPSKDLPYSYYNFTLQMKFFIS